MGTGGKRVCYKGSDPTSAVSGFIQLRKLPLQQLAVGIDLVIPPEKIPFSQTHRAHCTNTSRVVS